MNKNKICTPLLMLILLQMLVFAIWGVGAFLCLDQCSSIAEVWREGLGPQQALLPEAGADAGFRLLLVGALVISVLGAALTATLAIFAYCFMIRPIKRLVETARAVSAGGHAAPSGFEGPGDLGEIGRALDALLEERIETQIKTERDAERLQASAIVVVQAMLQLRHKDLTVEAESADGVTKPVVEALNRMTRDLAKALLRISSLSEGVARASAMVKAQSDAVFAVASAERDEVDRTAGQVTAAADAMSRMAELTAASNATVASAAKATGIALETVTVTTCGVIASQNTMCELESRIKRVGERSQEIGGVLNLVNTLAERTHILALNASMHAASAGEPGRGFLVVADEVKQLVETARGVMTQIAALVGNIQAESMKSVDAISAALAQSTEGARLAERAGEQLRFAQQAMADLALSVQHIAACSREQAAASNELRNRARQMQDSTRQTNYQLQQQTQHTKNLVKCTMELLGSVREFKLPNRI